MWFDGMYKPMLPIQLYKHHVQFQYNKGKSGIDKSTKAGFFVTHVTPLSFETKYVLTMINSVLSHCWRNEMPSQ